MLLDLSKLENIKLSDGNAKIRIDKFNQRIKIISIDGDIEELMSRLAPFITQHKVGKLVYIAKREKIEEFKKQGFIMEAKVENFFNGAPGYFLSKFLTYERKMSIRIPEEEEVLIKAREYINEDFNYSVKNQFLIRNANKEDAKELAELYHSIFETYPSPMNDSEYIKFAMDNNVFFKVAVYDGKIVSSASADTDPKHLNAEITDCATKKSHRGTGLMGRLIYELEKELRIKNYKVLYSTARSISTGMNIVFAKHNYEYAGRLINHCHICGQFEDMNIWMKTL
ncbi:putative beta-lysine N-acetyltransferase [Clostridium sp. DJ247]|uniref:putative beta-lysine N-acetyltransferase n=1 Tax=Clostridium sp. DJ247 TaxID=2726188 RepID=UPI00162A68CD|nr:putative beta-lysine N-acetyltransferase [Clostridium sp. DJ247]MBC2582084.1 putative beta-lysine N-acetyltransferase [Clostridium sp. DJ247]